MNADKPFAQQSPGVESSSVFGQSRLSDDATGQPCDTDFASGDTGSHFSNGGDWRYEQSGRRVDDSHSDIGRLPAGYGESRSLGEVHSAVPLDSLVWIVTCFCIGYWLTKGVEYVSRKDSRE